MGYISFDVFKHRIKPFISRQTAIQIIKNFIDLSESIFKNKAYYIILQELIDLMKCSNYNQYVESFIKNTNFPTYDDFIYQQINAKTIGNIDNQRNIKVLFMELYEYISYGSGVITFWNIYIGYISNNHYIFKTGWFAHDDGGEFIYINIDIHMKTKSYIKFLKFYFDNIYNKKIAHNEKYNLDSERLEYKLIVSI